MLRNLWFTKAALASAAAPTPSSGDKAVNGNVTAVNPPSSSAEASALSSPPDVTGAIRHIHSILAALATRLSAVESRFSLAASSLSGLGALQAAVAHDHHRAGRGLAACARAVLMDKLHVCPPKRQTSSEIETQAKSSVRVEVVCTLAAMEELMDINKLVPTEVRHRLPGRQSLKVQVKSFRALADALCMTPTMQAAVMVRSFRRGEVTRVVVEQHKTEAGQLMYILERMCSTGEVKVAMRDTEVYDGRQRRFLSALDVKLVKLNDVPGLPKDYPSTMTWTESRHGVASTVGGHNMAAGKLLLSVPVSVVQGTAADLAGHLAQ